MSHLDLIREEILELNSEIKSQPEDQEIVITKIKKKIEGFRSAKLILLEILSYTPSKGEPVIDRDDVTCRLNKCIQFLSEAELILSQFETSCHK